MIFEKDELRPPRTNDGGKLCHLEKSIDKKG